MFRKLSTIAIIMLAVFLFATKAQASDWPTSNLNTSNSQYISDPSILNPSPVAPTYLETAFAMSDYVIGADKLFMSDGSATSKVTAYDLASMSISWSINFPKRVSSIIYAGGRVYLSADKVYALNALNGQEEWSLFVANYSSQDKLLQIENDRIYGVIGGQLAIISQSGTLLYKGSAQGVEWINDMVLTPDRVLLSYGTSFGGGGGILAWDKTSFQYIGRTTRSRSSIGTMVYDPVSNIVYLSATNAMLCGYNASTLLPVFAEKMINMSRLVKYGSKYYSAYGKRIQSFNVSDSFANVSYSADLMSSGNFTGAPVIINGVMYEGTTDGRLMGRSLENNSTKFWDINPGSSITKIEYAAGRFFIKSSTGSILCRIYIYGLSSLDLAPRAAGTISVSSPYNTAGKNQYLGQLHAHTEIETQLDWTKTIKTPPTVYDVESRYKDAGYSFVALTEHNRILPNPAVDGLLHIQDSEEITQGAGGDHILAVGINSKIEPTGTDQERIDQVVNQGGLPILAHPNSNVYPFSHEKLRGLRFPLLEIFNTSVEFWRYFGGSGISSDKWDWLLSAGYAVFGTAGDDYTPYDGNFDGAAVSTYSLSNSQSDILSNLKIGNFYALEGSKAPRITNLACGNSSVHIEVNEASDISIIGKGGELLQKSHNSTMADYHILGDEIYVRVEIQSVATGLKTWSQPISISKVESITAAAGIHDLALNQAILHANTTGNVTAGTLGRNNYPSSMPPLGYMSPVYQFATTGQVLGGNTLAISYASNKLPVSPANLSIFTYNESSQQWEKVSSVLDPAGKLVVTNLPHYSLYTLSADTPADNEAPSVMLKSPSNLLDLNSDVGLTAEAADNQAVTAVRFIVDGRQIGYDNDGRDGWAANLATADFVIGNHKLIIEAEDFSGNRTEKEYDISFSGGITPPIVSIISPGASDYVSEIGNISGTYLSQLDVSKIVIALNGIFIAHANIDTDTETFTYAMDWQRIGEGSHKLGIALTDAKGNTVTAETEINVGNKVTARMLSPHDTSYLRNGTLTIKVETTPLDAPIAICLDGVPAANGQVIDLVNYSLGQHQLDVIFKDEIIAAGYFEIITSYADTQQLIERLYREGHINNYGIKTAIGAQLAGAESAAKLGLSQMSHIMLENLSSFINQQSRTRNQKIDAYAQKLLIENIGSLCEDQINQTIVLFHSKEKEIH